MHQMIPKHVSSIYSAACQNPNLDTGKVLWFTGFGTKKKKKNSGSEFWSYLFERAVSDAVTARVLMLGYCFSVAKGKLKSLH